MCENESTPRFTSIQCMSWSRFASIQYFNVCHGLVKEAVGRLGLCHEHGQVVYLNRVFISVGTVMGLMISKEIRKFEFWLQYFNLNERDIWTPSLLVILKWNGIYLTRGISCSKHKMLKSCATMTLQWKSAINFFFCFCFCFASTGLKVYFHSYIVKSYNR